MKITDLYKVETLDTRFSPGGQAEQKPLPDARPSKWRTPEYYIYYLFFLTIPPLMFKAVYDVSQPTHPHYAKYEPLLSPGWIPGRKVDNSDTQYRGFRDNIPYMACVVILHPLIRRAYESWTGASTIAHANGHTKSTADRTVTANARLESRVRFDLVFGLMFLIALHGVSAAKVLLLVYVNFQIATALPRPYVPVTTWIFNIGLLFANELYHGYPFVKLFAPVSSPTGNWGAWLDSYGGLIPRWEVLFNFTVLRLIAFSFDYIWMRDRRESSPVEVGVQRVWLLQSWCMC